MHLSIRCTARAEKGSTRNIGLLKTIYLLCVFASGHSHKQISCPCTLIAATLQQVQGPLQHSDAPLSGEDQWHIGRSGAGMAA